MPWERPCWGQVPALSSPVIQAASCPPPMGPPLPACRGNAIVVSSRMRSLAPALLRERQGPSLTKLQQLDHGHHAGLRWRAALLGSPVLLPGHPGAAGGSLRHPAGRRKGVGAGKGEASAKRLGAVRLPGASERRGLRSGAPRRLRAPALSPSLSCRTLWSGGRSRTEHMQCSGVSQREVTKGPTVMRCPGREGQGVPWGGTEPAQRWAPGCSWRASRPPFALMSPRDLPVALGCVPEPHVQTPWHAARTSLSFRHTAEPCLSPLTT